MQSKDSQGAFPSPVFDLNAEVTKQRGGNLVLTHPTAVLGWAIAPPAISSLDYFTGFVIQQIRDLADP